MLGHTDIDGILRAWASQGQATRLGYPPLSPYCRWYRPGFQEESPPDDPQLTEHELDAIEAAVLALEPRVRMVITVWYLYDASPAERVRRLHLSWREAMNRLDEGRARIAHQIGLD